MAAGACWYSESRDAFIREESTAVVSTLANSATSRGWHIELEQHAEWVASVQTLQGSGERRRTEAVDVIQEALRSPELSELTDVILEYDFRRRGLRIDCVLTGPGVVAVLEFKRSKLAAADRDQVMHYCISLMEFHEETQRLASDGDVVVVPILVTTREGARTVMRAPTTFHRKPWGAVLSAPVECGRGDLTVALEHALTLRRSRHPVSAHTWQQARFSPSSTILDAAISLFGQHDVSAIGEHAAPARLIDTCVEEVQRQIRDAADSATNRIIFVSGAPGAGKTLVGLKLAFSSELRSDAVFVTGNAPLVDVLSLALKKSYQGLPGSTRGLAATGYALEDVHQVIRNSTFKIVKAHKFLGERGKRTGSSDGRVVIFDEAQRTYEKGRLVARQVLEDHEADLVLSSLEESYEGGAVVVALLGHHPALNTGARGMSAGFDAAKRRGWDYSVSDATLAQLDPASAEEWAQHPRRLGLQTGHLAHSMRFYRNKGVEEWAHEVLDGEPSKARTVAERLGADGNTLWLTRDLDHARAWVRTMRVGEERMGLIASGQARRLAAEGLFVDLKPPVDHWMLAPSGDVRSSNMLEVVQNQYQVQGLELDYTVVCWDADLRRSAGDWASFRIRGAGWNRDSATDVAKNGYRVLLTRARKGMVLFVPRGDLSGLDATRTPAFYDGVAEFLLHCGAQSMASEPSP